MNPAKKAYYTLRYLGPRIVWLRGGVYLRKYLKLTDRVFRPRPWEEIRLGEILKPGTPAAMLGYAAFKRVQKVPFLFPLGSPPQIPPGLRDSAERQPAWPDRLRLIEDDRPVYFYRTPSPTSVDWYYNPLDDKRSDPTQFWWQLPDFAPWQGDMRLMWEPSRAVWAFDLARARASGEPIDAGGLFWRWLGSWMEACPPYYGFQWKCGQESSARMIATSLAFWATAHDPAAMPDRFEQFARFAWATGYRVAHHINYAISQKNNHALSEACGLMLIATLFPEFKAARRWWKKGRRVLAAEIRRQLDSDGSYVQSSMNYERVMLDACTLGLRLAELAGEPLDRDLYERLDRCNEFMFQMMEPSSGRMPNYGANDGAHMLPLTECDFTDYRPMLQSVHYLVHRKRLLPPGPWDESLLWLFGPDALSAAQAPPRQPVSSAFRQGGYYTIRTPESWGMIRCHTYRDRPGHCDALHLDFWWRGQNVLLDCGSYRYYVHGRPDIEHYFKSVQAHNTVEIDGKNYLEAASRFLWFPWPAAREVKFEVGGPVQLFTGEHDGYNRAPWHVVHRRTVVSLPGDQGWMVADDLVGSGEHHAVARWHMMDAPYELDEADKTLRLDTPKGPLFFYFLAPPSTVRRLEVVRGRDESGRFQGFASPYYGEMSPVPTMEFEVAGTGTLHIRTILSPKELNATEITALRRRLDGLLSGGRRNAAARPAATSMSVPVSSTARDD